MDTAQILHLAIVPEHSVTFMENVSGGHCLVEGDYVFYAAADWCMAIGYPFRGHYSHNAFSAALATVRARTHATDFWAVGPDMPAPLHEHIQERDIFYILDANAPIPHKLKGPVRNASQRLHLEVGTDFTPEHRQLWAEFMARVPLRTHVRELFATTQTALAAQTPKLILLNAWDAERHLAASLLVDEAPTHFCAYMLGAHSRTHYSPHAADALFALMLARAHEQGKRFIHLGLGVNEGITRFKRKWGGQEQLPYIMAAWKETPTRRAKTNDARDLFLAVLGCPQKNASAAQSTSQRIDAQLSEGLSKRQIIAQMPEQRPYAMLWELTKNGKTSWIGGSAHFFCYSFENSLRALFNKVDTVIFEGPLDAESLHTVEIAGKTCTDIQRPLFPLLTANEIAILSRMVRGPEGLLPRLLNMEAKRKIDVLWYLQNSRPWSALFTCWTGFLERFGWSQSVDLDAWFLAKDMGKTVIGMESLEEQIASLDSVLPERVVRYFQHCHKWPAMVRHNVSAYLAGDLTRLMGTSAEFPTRTERIIGHRDELFRQRMRPFIEAGRCAVFVGTAHMLNLRGMLAEDGFAVRQVLPTWKHRLKAWGKQKTQAKNDIAFVR